MTPAQYNGILAALQAIGSVSVTGQIILYGSITAPTGYLPCDGSSVLRATYPALFAVIGTSFGAVDGTHFTVPDLRSRLPMGVGAGPGLTVRALADQGGVESQIVGKANLAPFALNITDPGHVHAVPVTDPGHVHTVAVTDPGHKHPTANGDNFVTDGSTLEFSSLGASTGSASLLTGSNTTGITAGADSNTTGITAGASSNTTGLTVASGGSSTPLPTVDPFTAVMYFIKT